MLIEFKKYIDKHNLIEKDDKILLALSGGVDSMVLANLLLAVSRQLSANSQIFFAHCNFHLRGEDSDRDESFVTDFAIENNIPLFVKHFDTETYARDNSLSIEMAARELRYAWFEELRNLHDINKVALAHHGDDQIETFFINFLRGSGIKGLKGMKPQNDFYIRPLLWSNRNQIEKFAKENGIRWVEDYTNNETIYLRNKIRHQIIPLFDELKDNARQSLNFSINCLSSENELYRCLIDEKISDIEFVKDDYRYIESRHFIQDNNGKQLLFEWVRRFGFNYEQTESMFEAMRLGKSGVVFYPSSIDNRQQTTDNRLCPHFVSGLIASVQKDRIEIFKNNNQEENFQILRFSDSQILKLSDSQILKFSILENDNNFQLIKDLSVAQFDMDKINFPLKLRHWKKGDKFKPIGMKGSKLLSDFFNDLGFSTYQKQNVWIMEDSNGLILWIVGYRINDKIKISETTRHIFQCEIKY